MKVYHGTIKKYALNIWTRGITLNFSDESADFGKGFYTSTKPAFAEITVINKSEKLLARRDKFKYNNSYNPEDYIPYVVVFEFDGSIKPLDFEVADLKWFQFVVNNRNGYYYVRKVGETFHNLQSEFDIVRGPIADGDIVNVVNQLLFINRKANASDLIGMPFPVNTDTQISFHTVEAFKTLAKCDYYEVGGDKDE